MLVGGRQARVNRACHGWLRHVEAGLCNRTATSAQATHSEIRANYQEKRANTGNACDAGCRKADSVSRRPGRYRWYRAD